MVNGFHKRSALRVAMLTIPKTKEGFGISSRYIVHNILLFSIMIPHPSIILTACSETVAFLSPHHNRSTIDHLNATRLHGLLTATRMRREDLPRSLAPARTHRLSTGRVRNTAGNLLFWAFSSGHVPHHELRHSGHFAVLQSAVAGSVLPAGSGHQ